MTEIERIVQQMRRGFEGDAWYGPALAEALDGVDAETAVARPIPSAHSIWEIALHLVATQKLLLQRIGGDPGPTPRPPVEDWPKVPEATESAWSGTLATLRSNEEAFRDAVGKFPVDRLESPLVPGGSNAYDNFHGYVQHTVYHAAQITILKKAVVG